MWDADDAYDRFMGRWSRLLAPSVVAAALAGGAGRARWLDVGGGTGAVTAAALDAGVSHVDALEPSPAFAAALCRRFVDRPVTVHRMGAPSVPPGPFDAAVSSLVVNFTPDPVQTLKSISSVLTPEGFGVAAVWDMTEPRSFLWRVWATVERLDGARSPADERTMWPVCSRAGLGDAAARAGWNPSVTAVEIPTPFSDIADLWDPMLLGIGPVGAWIAGRTDDQRTELRDALAADILDDGPPAVFTALMISTG